MYTWFKNLMVGVQWSCFKRNIWLVQILNQCETTIVAIIPKISSKLGRTIGDVHCNSKWSNIVLILQSWCCPTHQPPRDRPEWTPEVSNRRKNNLHHSNICWIEFNNKSVNQNKDKNSVAKFQWTRWCRVTSLSNEQLTPEIWQQVLPNLQHWLVVFIQHGKPVRLELTTKYVCNG